MAERNLKDCHDEGRHILTMGKMKLHASSNRHSYARYELAINLTGYVSNSYDCPMGEFGGQQLLPSFLQPWSNVTYVDTPQVIIPWKDGGVPKFTKDDWMRLIDDLSKINGRVLIHCIGGHGRTGTACAILLALSGALKKDPVTWLRKNYCKKAVETNEQIKYIQSLGIKTTEKESHVPYVYVDASKGIPVQWFKQDQYNLTKSDVKQIYDSSGYDFGDDSVALYKCIQCQRKRVASYFYQTFLDMTGYCWACRELAMKVSPDIQSA